MNTTPMITIIMPAFNAQKYLEEAVESVRAQTFTDWELLIIDDCSNDQTYSIMRQLKERDSRIRVLQNEHNIGVAATRNYGITLARGEWVAFLDSDDLWAETKLEKQVELIANDPGIMFTFTGSAYIEDDGMTIAYQLKVPEKVDRRKLTGRNIVSCSSVVLKKELLLRHPMPDNRSIHEDFATWLSILEEIPYAYGVNEPLLIYRRALASKSGNKSKSANMNWNTYEVAHIDGLRRILAMLSYTYHGITKYMQLRFYSYNQMLRKERLKKFFLFVMRFLLLSAWTAVFAKIWIEFYNYKDVIRGVFVFWGHVALFTLYFFTCVVVGKACSAFNAIHQTIPELCLSQFLTALVVNSFTLLEIALIGRWNFSKLVKYSPPMFALMVLNFILALFWSLLIRWLYATIYPPHDLLLITGDQNTEYLEAAMRKQKKHFQINGIHSVEEDQAFLEKEIMRHEGIVLGAMPLNTRNRFVKFCYENKKRCYCQTTIIDILLMQADRIFVEDIPMYLYKNCGMTLEQRICKRMLDLLVSAFVLIILSPLYLVIAIIVKLISRDHILEKEVCLTKNGKTYKRLKFRTHRKDGSLIDGLSWLLRFHLDELPQFYSILKGEMSVVGPYPETVLVATKNREIFAEAWYRQEVKAGLTGYAQVYGKYTTSQKNKLKMDIYYVQNYSIALDISIIVMTAKVLFTRQRL